MPKRSTGMPAEVRRKEMLERLNIEGHITVSEFCEQFQLSPATVRNDLNALERQKFLRRTHGGALSMTASIELTTQEKLELHSEEKQRIARLALPLIQHGQVIAIDTGTTTYELARLIADMTGITVVTNDVKIANYLEGNGSASVILLGGAVRKNFHCTVGNSVLRQMDHLYADVLFLATNAVNLEHGLCTPSIDIADIKRKLIQNSRTRVLLADSSKIGCESFAGFASIDELDMLITDAAADPDFVRRVEAKDVEVLLA